MTPPDQRSKESKRSEEKASEEAEFADLPLEFAGITMTDFDITQYKYQILRVSRGTLRGKVIQVENMNGRRFQGIVVLTLRLST